MPPRPAAGCPILGRREGASVGCIGIRSLSIDTCEIKRPFVTARARVQGVGERLACAAIGTIALLFAAATSAALAQERPILFIDTQAQFDPRFLSPRVGGTPERLKEIVPYIVRRWIGTGSA